MNMRGFPPRLPGQTIFYPVSSENYATKMARDWNATGGREGFVTRFQVLKSYLDQYEIKEAGGTEHSEYWIPSADMNAFNAAIVGEIEITAEFP
jgi:hypothetical protein